MIRINLVRLSGEKKMIEGISEAEVGRREEMDWTRGGHVEMHVNDS